MIICLSCRLDKKDCCKVLGPFLLLNAAEVTLSSALETKCSSPGFVFRKKLRPFKESAETKFFLKKAGDSAVVDDGGGFVTVNHLFALSRFLSS